MKKDTSRGVGVFKKAVLALSLSLTLLTPNLALAAATDLPCVPSKSPANAPTDGTVAVNNDLFDCINKLYKYALIVASIAGVFMIMLGGYMYIFSGGNEKKVGTAKSFITSSLLGIAVLLTGFLLLRQINPSLTTVKSITPSQIAQREWETIDDDWNFGAGGKGGNIGGAGVPGNNGSPGGHNASELQCGFQGNKANYVPFMTEALFQAIKQVCAEVKAQGFTADISSISTGHLAKPGSLHNKGCAVDFAGGNSNYVNTPVGKALIAAGTKAGLRINPGTDANQTFHVHMDVGISNCTAPVLPTSSRS